MATPNYDINYDDPKLTSVRDEESDAIKNDGKIYDDAISAIDENTAAQQDAIDNYAAEQKKIQ